MSFILLPLLSSSLLLALLFFLLVHHPITKLAFIILIFLLSGLLFLDLGFYFLGLSYIIVYVGAIAILFLFVIMMVPTSYPTSSPSINLSFLLLSLSLLSTLSLLSSLPDTFPLLHSINWYSDLLEYNDIHSLAFLSFFAHPLSIFLLAYLLWIVLIGLLSIIS